MKDLYEMIFKRKSMRKFDEALALTEAEISEVKEQTVKLVSLAGEIKVRFEIVKRANTTAKWGEYCLIMYSEKKPLYLLNAGYMLEQMDLFLASRDIGACWYGLAKTKVKQTEGLNYVIMLAFGKSRPQDFRKNVSEFKRKSREEIWQGDFDADVTEAVRLAPSACNTQSWRFVSSGNLVKVYRGTNIMSFIPFAKMPYYNSVDMGICLCFLEIALLKKDFKFERTLIKEGNPGSDPIEVASYSIN